MLPYYTLPGTNSKSMLTYTTFDHSPGSYDLGLQVVSLLTVSWSKRLYENERAP